METAKEPIALSAIDKVALKNAVSATQSLQREIQTLQGRQNEIMASTFRALADAHGLEVPEGAEILIGPSLERAETIKVEMPRQRGQTRPPLGPQQAPQDLARQHAEAMKP